MCFEVTVLHGVIIAPTEGRQKMSGAGNLKIDQAEKRGHRQEDMNGQQLTTKK
jgi:hypothetical protein